MWYFAFLALAAGLSVPLAVFAAAAAQGRIGAAALEGIARQPEAAGRIQMVMIIALALVESLAIYALLVALIILFVIGLPGPDQILPIIQAEASRVAAP